MTDIKVTLINTLKDIDPLTWDQCACPETKNGARPLDPFTTYRFLFALEESKSVGENTGWAPNYLIASRCNWWLQVLSLINIQIWCQNMLRDFHRI